MLSLPADVIPRIVSTPMCAQSLAATCKWMRGCVRSDIFIFVNEVVWDDVTTSVDAIKLYARSDYYTAISAPMNESGFMNAFSAGFTRESGPNLRVFGTILVREVFPSIYHGRARYLGESRTDAARVYQVYIFKTI